MIVQSIDLIQLYTKSKFFVIDQRNYYNYLSVNVQIWKHVVASALFSVYTFITVEPKCKLLTC